MTACWACWRADVSVGSGGCAFLWGMQNLQTLSLARTRLEHDSMAAVLANLTALTTLSLGWCALPFLFHPECTEMGPVRMYGAMAAVLGNPKSLTTLELALCAALCDASLELADCLCQVPSAMISRHCAGMSSWST